jgi:hypothetical protein
MRRSILVAALAASALSSVPAFAETVTLVYDIGERRKWRIDEPNVSEPSTTYPQIQLNIGEWVYFSAGGCVQTGGKGLTWKRYVGPQGPNSEWLYHGEIFISGAMAALTPMSYFITDDGGSNPMLVSVPGYSTRPIYLTLGYTDDDYSDNGYWGHDNGTNDQCKGVGNAWVEIEIHKHPH